MLSGRHFRTGVRFPPPPLTQPIRTALRGFVEQIEDLEGGFRLVVRPAHLGPNGAEPNGSQYPTQDESRACSLLAEQFTHRCDALGNPSEWWHFEDGASGRFEDTEVRAEILDPALGFGQRLPQGAGALPLADELDEVGDAARLDVQPTSGELDRLGKVSVKPPDFGLDPCEDIVNGARIRDPLADRLEYTPLDESTADQQLVGTRFLRCREASI